MASRLNVMDFIIHPRDRVLVAATLGRGVWVIDVSGTLTCRGSSDHSLLENGAG